ncbi:transcriptional regulator, GntR family [Franzmannia pantelleriensis]|uniref:Transcriptional regulator, GntR family n=1 Tax=Franzmannia pantelleriensis TaxID=48727 RepID=A0A1G9SRT4_9GAMM|nr:PLP-dependent aminotransferase family protein [Halomonas pantelleriensis]SDM38179.1 transcriptional regulator, GntR family [Halomonas pantelleriensis]
MTIWVPELSSQGPRYRALSDAIAVAIERGELVPGDRLPPQRRLADALGVTVGTVTRGYAEAERQGWLQARIGSGTYVRGGVDAAAAFPLPGGERGEGLIDLSLSLPPPHPLRAEALGRALNAIARQPRLLQASVEYQAADGLLDQRRQLAEWLASLDMPLPAEELLITQGGQHGISLALTSLLRPGERIATDALTYPGLIGAAQQAHLKVDGIAMDADGMDVEALARLCARQAPRLVYVTPDQNNPTGASLSEARRQRLAALAREYDFWLLEDGVQYLPAPARGTPLYQLAPERTLFVFSTAKVLAGGLRIGILRAPERLRERLAAGLRAQSWMVPPLMIAAVCQWLASGDAETLLAWQCEELAARQALARKRLAGFEVSGQPLGANLWLTLPHGMRSAALVEALASRDVRVTSAEPFCVGSEPAPQAIRLCLSAAASREALDQALQVLLDALESPPLAPATL